MSNDIINRLGQYNNITSFQDAPWLFTTETHGGSDSKRLAKEQKEDSLESKKLIYPALLAGVPYITDPEWQAMVTKAAYGVFPMGFSHRKDGISYNCSGKRVFLTPDPDPYNAVAQIIEFFRSTGGIKTTQDIQVEANSIASFVKQGEIALQTRTWKDLNPKGKNKAIIDYVNTVAKKMNLNKSDKDWLYTIINLGILNGSIKDDDIDYRDGYIFNIKNVGYDEVRKKFYYVSNGRKGKCNLPRGLYSNEVYFSPSANNQLSTFKGFGKLWTKYNQQQFRQAAKQLACNSQMTSRMTERPPVSVQSDSNFYRRMDSLDIETPERDARITSDQNDNYDDNYKVGLNLPTMEDLMLHPEKMLLCPRYELMTTQHTTSTF